MVSNGCGRGRGRGHMWEDCEKISLPKPGKSNFEDTACKNLINIISTTDVESLLQKSHDIFTFIEALAKKDNLEYMCNELYKHSQTSKEFGQKLMMVYFIPSIHKIQDSNERTIKYYVLTDLQNRFNKREKVREENVDHFYTDIHSLSNYLKQVVTPTSQYKHMQVALLDYMHMLLETAFSEDITIFAEQIAVFGKHFYTSCTKKVSDVMITARRVLLEEDLPLVSRQMLLYTIDLDSRNFEPLPTDLRNFYKLQFEKNSVLFNCL